jgi:GNAT superfamily N-acetyltransferase
MAQVRPAVISDVEGIAKVHVQSWQETYRGIVPDSYLATLSVDKRIQVWTRILQDAANITFVAELHGEIVGFVSGGAPQEAQHGIQSELASMYLLKKAQDRGIGKKLFQVFVDCVKSYGYRDMYLWVLRDNPTVGFYQKRGASLLKSANIEMDGIKLIEDMFVWKFDE